jgi:hypothetical protein
VLWNSSQGALPTETSLEARCTLRLEYSGELDSEALQQQIHRHARNERIVV